MTVIVLQLCVSRLAPNRLVENIHGQTRCNFTICNFDTECVESQSRREKLELSIDLDRGLDKECSISPSQNIWRGTESSSTRVRSLIIALFSRPIFLRRFSSPLPSSSLQVWDRPVEPVTGGGYLRLWFSADSQEKREERKEEGDSEKGNHKSKRKTTDQ